MKRARALGMRFLGIAESTCPDWVFLVETRTRVPPSARARSRLLGCDGRSASTSVFPIGPDEFRPAIPHGLLPTNVRCAAPTCPEYTAGCFARQQLSSNGTLCLNWLSQPRG